MNQVQTDYRRLFPITEHLTYLNHAACSPLPKPGVDAAAKYWREQSTEGVLSEARYFPVVDRAREKVAQLIGADPGEIGWTQNTSTALNMVAHGLRWERGQNVVTVQGEFPANVYPWLGLAEQGVETRLVPMRENRVLISDIAAAMDERTRMLSISFVEFATGFRNDLYKLGQLCAERGVLFTVDAIQGLGALQLDVHRAGVHFLGAGAHKWLMGPQGVGIFYARRDMLPQLRPITASWYSVVNRDDHLTYGQPWVAANSRVEGSTHNVSGIVTFDAVLDMILGIGPAVIEERVLSLSTRLIEGLRRLGYSVVSPDGPGEQSGVVCFRATGDPMDMLARAQAEGIVVAVRVGVVRVSPHFYNTEDEIDKFLGVLGGA